MPGLDILAKIKRLNHDGYGFVSTNHFHKGLDYRTFLRHLSEVSSKFAMMYKGKVKLYGDYKELDGVYYSNLRWQ